MTFSFGDDGDSWSRALAGDPAGVAQLYDRHATAIFNHCFQRLVSRADAEDITAEVFIVALSSGAELRLDPDAGLRPWLLAVANNLLRRQARSRAAAGRASRRLQAELGDVPDIADRVVDESMNLYYLRIIRGILSELPVADRDLIQLCLVQGIPPGVVAELTGARPGTVRSRLSRALARARRALDRHENAPPRGSFPDSAMVATAVPTPTLFEFERGI